MSLPLSKEKEPLKLLLSGNEAMAYAALHTGISLGTGYPGTPSTEILETFDHLGGRAQWAPNEKVALEVAIGVSFGGARALATMKHVGLNVAADPLLTAAYVNTDGALIVVTADDPGMASSQNEQDNRYFALMAHLPVFEPSDSQETYDFFFEAIRLSETWKIPVLFRMTTRVCHSRTLVDLFTKPCASHFSLFKRDIRGRVMIPSNARPAHARLIEKLKGITEWNENSGPHISINQGKGLAIISSGIAYMYCREAVPEASILKLGVTHPLPIDRIRAFIEEHREVYVIEEGEPILYRLIRSEGLEIKGKPSEFRLGELSVEKVRSILGKTTSLPPALNPGKPPALCNGCPHRTVFTLLKKHDCIVSGDIGCYSLGVLPPFEAMDSLVCMGAAIGVGLGLRHVLGKDQVGKVVSVIGDSTFMHSGLTGLLEMAYNPPKEGHLVVILDNQTTAMTGLQEHPGTGRSLNHGPAAQIFPEKIAQAMNIKNVIVIDPIKEPEHLEATILKFLSEKELSVIVVRRPCLLAAKRIRDLEKNQNE